MAPPLSVRRHCRHDRAGDAPMEGRRKSHSSRLVADPRRLGRRSSTHRRRRHLPRAARCANPSGTSPGRARSSLPRPERRTAHSTRHASLETQAPLAQEALTPVPVLARVSVSASNAFLAVMCFPVTALRPGCRMVSDLALPRQRRRPGSLRAVLGPRRCFEDAYPDPAASRVPRPAAMGPAPSATHWAPDQHPSPTR